MAGWQLWLRIAPARSVAGAVRNGAGVETPEHERLTILPLVRAADRARTLLPGKVRCLPHALALRSMLLRRGMTANLRIGAAGRKGKFDFHAWLEAGGRPLTASLPSGRYRPLR
jgi:hypothetical protein